jgi:hypothetical protein
VNLTSDIRRVVEGWRAVVAVCVLAGAIGVAAAFLFPKVYESSLDLQIGQSLGEPLEDPYAVAAFLQSAGFQSQLPEAYRDVGTTLVSVRVDEAPGPKPTGLLRVVVRGRTAENAAKAANVVSERTVARHAELYERAVKQTDEYRATLQRRLDGIMENAAQMDALIRTSPPRDANALTVLMVLQDRNEQIIRLSKELRDVNIEHATRTNPTVAVAAPTVPAAAAWPRPIVFGIVAAIVGFAVAVASILIAPVLFVQSVDVPVAPAINASAVVSSRG